MKMRTFLLLILLPAIGLLAFNASDYMPLSIGNTWVTEDSIDMETYIISMSIADTATVLGHFSYLALTIDDAEIESTFYQMRPAGLYEIVISEGAIEMFFMPTTFNIGDTWTVVEMDTVYNSGTYTTAVQWATYAEVLGQENCTVPAGFFPNCVKAYTYGYP